MRTWTALLVAGIALGTSAIQAPPRAPAPGVQLADMGMGDAGPQLGGSQDDMLLDDPGHVPAEADMITSDPGHIPAEADMVVDDPGHIPAEADMVVTDPGHVPREAQMDVGIPQDDDQQDDITE